VTKKITRSLERGLDILFAFSHDTPSLNIDEISTRTGIPRSTCYRLVHTLKKKELLDFVHDSGRYKLGIGLMKLDSIVQGSLDIITIAKPHLQKLATISGETVQLVLRNHNVAVCIDRVESSETLRVRPDKGTIIGLHSGASGKAIMAFLSREEREQIIRETGLKPYGPNTVTEVDKLETNLAQIKKNGYAVSEQEISVGVKALAAPIFDSEGMVVASVCVAGPIERLHQEKLSTLTSSVLETARAVSRQLGNLKI
jgi:IclR family transcriptional regulator, KDG regulon repressor